ncbi:MAG TPA: hypothetical protein VGB75_05945 [Jatrophihabitans sp.]|jgi:Flp pilus assembly protein TadG|uniref:hypothetical protein n=1 Tax=Jatrophihabitans sp. TaxID=1932789 RepID=UPI002EE910EC
MRSSTVTAVLLAATLWAAPAVAEASFNQQAASAQSASSALLNPPTNLSSSRSSCALTMSWTPTVDAKASGYKLLNYGTPLPVTLAPKTLNNYRFNMTKNVTYSLTLVTTYLNWTSSPTPAIVVKC